MYTVEKTGFRSLVCELDKRYDMPRKNYFMYTEIPKLYQETRSILAAQLAEKPFYACTTALWTSRAVDTYMAVTIQFISVSWEMQSWCLGRTAMYSDHTAESLTEALEETVTETWELDMSVQAL